MDDQDRYTRITLRIPKNLHAQLQAAADATSKSMNAEIIARLQDSFVAESEFHIGPGLFGPSDLAKVAQEAAERTAHEYRLALAEALRGLSSADALREAAQKALDDTSIAKTIPPKK
jgi:hypothetical protein